MVLWQQMEEVGGATVAIFVGLWATEVGVAVDDFGSTGLLRCHLRPNLTVQLLTSWSDLLCYRSCW